MSTHVSIPTVIQYNKANLDSTELLELYKNMLKPRLIEEKMLILLRQGKISKWFSGIGQEAIAVGVTMSLKKEEYILPMHRNLGVFTTREIPLHRLFSQWQGQANGFTKGRDRSFHFGTQEFKIVGMISHLGPQLGVADGIALASKLQNKNQVTAVFTGEGGTNVGKAYSTYRFWQYVAEQANSFEFMKHILDQDFSSSTGKVKGGVHQVNEGLTKAGYGRGLYQVFKGFVKGKDPILF